MKECYWCKKSCPNNEEGSFEVDPKDNSIELGWICDHCTLRFDGKCECEECKADFKAAQEEIKRYDLAHPRKKGLLARLSMIFD